jgi:Domain of unknown function (DUF4112)
MCIVFGVVLLPTIGIEELLAKLSLRPTTGKCAFAAGWRAGNPRKFNARFARACIVATGTRPMPRQLASNEHLDYIAALLDDMFRIPGTQIRFGLDALIGWVPGIGDAMSGVASFFIVFAAWRRGVQAITLVRMIANVLLETTLGAIPVAGDVFHVFWKANRRNYKLLIREREQPGVNTRGDWIFLAIILFAAIAVVVIPIVILIFILWPYLQGRP